MASNDVVEKAMQEMNGRFRPAKAEGVDADIVFNITGDGGGIYTAHIKDGAVSMSEGAADNPRMTLITSDEDFIALVEGDINPMQAFMGGKIKVQGDMSMALKLQSMFDL